MKPLRYISNWLRSLVATWGSEILAVIKDPGVLIFFFALPTLYPIVYTVIYNPEVVEELPVAVVDNSRTARSRELARMVDATQAIHLIGYASDLEEAKRWMHNKDCYAIIEIPYDYDKRIGRNEQAVVPFYCDMSLLLRYRAILSSMTEIQLQLGTDIRAEAIGRAGLMGQQLMGNSKQVGTIGEFLGDYSQGFASFVMPGMFVLILQQSMVLGVTMLAAGRRERRRKLIPEPKYPLTATVLGRMLCYVTAYIPMVMYIFMVVPMMFSLPDVGNMWHYLIFILPLLIASAFFGMTLAIFVTERESSMLVVVFSSVVFLFLSGLTWPRYAMSPFWHMVGDLVPATWGVNGFIRMASDGAHIAGQAHDFKMLWVLAGAYFITALGVTRLLRGRRSAASDQ